jgi:hypothetical protein
MTKPFSYERDTSTVWLSPALAREARRPVRVELLAFAALGLFVLWLTFDATFKPLIALLWHS